MNRKIITCESCNAVFKLQHDMAERHYRVSFCPFCNDDLNIDNEDIIDDYEEDEWD
jgi:hypothetical protein